MEIKVKDINKILETYENIPLKEQKSDKQNAIDDIKDMLDILEKDINGELDGTEKNRLECKKDEWYNSVCILREYIENRNSN